MDIHSAEEVVSIFEVELQKPRNLSVHEIEERGYGEGVSTEDVKGHCGMMWYVHERWPAIFAVVRVMDFTR